MSLLSPEVESTYEVLQLMGEGGMGAVYKARHRVFNDLCVIKVMQAHLTSDPGLRERFENEARKGKQIDHPNIARVLNFFIGGNGNAHLVMEFIDGVSLRDVRARRGVMLDPATVVTIGSQVLTALACLHDHNLVHRDISPDNIMTVKDGAGAIRVKLIDLGIAKALDATTPMTQTGSFIGKPPYAAPEQFGGDVDARADLYSFGVVLYELLTGARPISGGSSVGSWASAHYSSPPLPFEESDPDGRVPEHLRGVVLKALEKQPGRRYQSASEFAAALRGPAAVADRTYTAGPGFERESGIPTIPAPQRPAPAAQPFAVAPPSGQPGASAGPDAARRIRSRRRLWRAAVALAILLTGGGVLWAVKFDDSLSKEDQDQLAGIIRKVVDEGRQPSIADGAIAAFVRERELQTDEVQPFTVEFAAKLRDAKKEIDRGKAAIARNDAREAYYAFAEAKRIDPDSSYAWANFGGAAMLLNKQAEATQAYQRALAIDPSNWLAHYNLACQFARAGAFDDAVAKVELAVTEMRRQHTPAEAKGILRSIREDEALKELRDDPRFESILAAR